MPRRQFAPRPALLSSAVSTPPSTLRVDVAPAGIVRHCAPLVRRQWLGQDWATMGAALEAHYGEALRISRRLPEAPQGATRVSPAVPHWHKEAPRDAWTARAAVTRGVGEDRRVAPDASHILPSHGRRLLRACHRQKEQTMEHCGFHGCRPLPWGCCACQAHRWTCWLLLGLFTLPWPLTLRARLWCLCLAVLGIRQPGPPARCVPSLTRGFPSLWSHNAMMVILVRLLREPLQHCVLVAPVAPRRGAHLG